MVDIIQEAAVQVMFLQCVDHGMRVAAVVEADHIVQSLDIVEEVAVEVDQMRIKLNCVEGLGSSQTSNDSSDYRCFIALIIVFNIELFGNCGWLMLIFEQRCNRTGNVVHSSLGHKYHNFLFKFMLIKRIRHCMKC